MEGCQQPVQAHNKGDVTTNPLNTHAASVLSTIPRGIMARILACHASDPGSIPGAGAFFSSCFRRPRGGFNRPVWDQLPMLRSIRRPGMDGSVSFRTA